MEEESYARYMHIKTSKEHIERQKIDTKLDREKVGKTIGTVE